MKLQILVPHYKETREEIKPLLDSIALQQNVDLENEVGVIICNDGPEAVSLEPVSWFDQYPFKVKYYECDHAGVSATRNACLAVADADYVMFCDADDMFYNACGLYILFREMEGDGFDALTSVFIEETRDPKTKKPVYINRNMDVTFVHGKVYRRQYLEDEHIQFNPMLTIHEDSYFNCLATKCAKEVKYCPTSFYLWKWRDASVCRHDPKYILKTFNNMLASSTALVKELLKRGKEKDAIFYATSMIYDSYFTMNKKEWIDQENQEYRDKTEKRFKQYYLDFKYLYGKIDETTKAQLIMGIKNRFFAEGLLMEAITFEDWIAHVLTL